MTAVGSWKWIEVGLLLVAGGAFVWWQLRDVRKAQESSRRSAAVQPVTADRADKADNAPADEDKPR